MIKNLKTFFLYFLQLMISAFLLFFLTVGLAKPAAAELLVYMNDKNVTKPIAEWVIFYITAPIATAVWCLLWVWFKKSEKYCIELIGK